MKPAIRVVVALAAGVAAGGAAYAGVIPGVGGRPDADAIVGGNAGLLALTARGPEALRAAQAQINDLNQKAMERAGLIAVGVALVAFVVVGMVKR